MDTLGQPVPTIPHKAAVCVDCGCTVPRAEGDTLELVCNECGIVEGSIDDAVTPGDSDIRWRTGRAGVTQHARSGVCQNANRANCQAAWPHNIDTSAIDE